MEKRNSDNQKREGKLHRLATVRKQERISWKSLSRRSGIPIAELKRQEDESRDLLLSTLYQWQHAIDVPIDELIAEPKDCISSSLQFKTKLIRLTKTVLLLIELLEDEKMRALVESIRDQLYDMMPGLKQIVPWPTRNYPRSKTELPRIIDQQISSDWFGEP